MTAAEIENQKKKLQEEMKRLEEEKVSVELGAAQGESSYKSKSFSKAMINWSYIVFAVVGITGSFLPQFDMTKFTMFLQNFAWLWAPLVLAVGGGRAYKNFVEKKYGNQSQPQQ